MAETLHLLVSQMAPAAERKNKIDERKKVSFELLVTGPSAPMKTLFIYFYTEPDWVSYILAALQWRKGVS